MNALLSIKPKYVESIMKGSKKYEFRKSNFKKKDIEKVFIYSTSPIKKIVGSFEIARVIEDHPIRLWNQLFMFSGLDYEDFFNYFKKLNRGFAIEIDNIDEFECPIDPEDLIPSFVPPQSFRYLDSSVFIC